jgi:hypothetical protein
MIEVRPVLARSCRAALGGHFEQTTAATPMERVAMPEYTAFMLAAHAIAPPLFVTG